MKVLIISNSISGGGAENSMRILNAAFIGRGIDSILVCLNNSGNDVASNGEVILDRAWKTGFNGTIHNFRVFVKILKERNPSTVIANCELPELYIAFSSTRIRNLISVEHTSMPWVGRRSIGVIVRFLLRSRKTTWVTVNRTQDGIWPYGNNSIFIPNPVNEPTLDESGGSNSPFVFVGRLRAEKGIEMILEAISNVNSSIDVFGSGNLEGNLQDRFHTHADFRGFVTNPWNMIHKDQTLVVASEYEGDGIVIVEAILAGLPILLLDNSDLRRFGLQEVNYFKNQSELETKLRQATHDCEPFRASPDKISEYKTERESISVVKSWLNILG